MAAPTACASATHAFLQKNYLLALRIIDGALESTREPTALEQLLVLRFTVVTSVCTHANVRQRVMDELTSLEDNFSKKWDALLQASAEVLYASLLYEAMFLCNEQDVPPALPKTLEPTANTASLLLKMPVTVLIAALHLALRLDSSETLQGAACARQTCEWYFDALLAPDAHVSATSYERVLRVYVLLVLGAHLHEWNYARDIVDYSTLAPPAKAALQRDVDHAQAADESRAQREEEALERARAVYVEEKARRTSTSPHGQIPTVPASDVTALPSPGPVFQDATIRPAALQRSASIRRRPVETKQTASSAGDETTYAMQRNAVQQSLARRQHDEVPSTLPSRPPTVMTTARSWLTSFLTLPRLLSLALLVLVLVGTRRVRKNRMSTSWTSWFVQRLWDTFQMYVFTVCLLVDLQGHASFVSLKQV